MRRATADRPVLRPAPASANGRDGADGFDQRVARRYLELRRMGTDPHYAMLGALDLYLAEADPSCDLDAAQERVIALCAAAETRIGPDARPAHLH